MSDTVSVIRAPEVAAPDTSVVSAHNEEARAAADHGGVEEVTREAVMKWIHDGHPEQQHDVRSDFVIFQHCIDVLMHRETFLYRTSIYWVSWNRDLFFSETILYYLRGYGYILIISIPDFFLHFNCFPRSGRRNPVTYKNV